VCAARTAICTWYGAQRSYIKLLTVNRAVYQGDKTALCWDTWSFFGLGLFTVYLWLFWRASCMWYWALWSYIGLLTVNRALWKGDKRALCYGTWGFFGLGLFTVYIGLFWRAICTWYWALWSYIGLLTVYRAVYKGDKGALCWDTWGLSEWGFSKVYIGLFWRATCMWYRAFDCI